jgi:hypothetical protein
VFCLQFIDATEWGELLVLSDASWTQGVEVPTEDVLSSGLDQCGQELVYPFYVNLLVSARFLLSEMLGSGQTYLSCIDRACTGAEFPARPASNELLTRGAQLGRSVDVPPISCRSRRSALWGKMPAFGCVRD